MKKQKSKNTMLKELEPWRDFIEEITPFGETPEQVMNDETRVDINAPRALMAQAFQSKIYVMHKLHKQGLLKEERLAYAKQQLIGYVHADRGDSIASLIDTMGLTKEEWEKIDRRGLGLKSYQIDFVDKYFDKNK